MGQRTLSGSHISFAAALPATFDPAGYEALGWTKDDCSLESVPELKRTYNGVTVDVVCQANSKTRKGKSSWNPVTFNMQSDWENIAQEILETAEASTTAVISVKMEFPVDEGKTTPDTAYFTAQVPEFSITNGGSGDTNDMRTATLWIQSTDVTRVWGA